MSEATQAQLRIEPADARVDVPRRIVARGLPPGPARLAATLRHPDGSLWQAEAHYQIGADGTLDLDAQAPVAGDWCRADAMAVVWALQRQSPPTDARLSDETGPLHTALTLTAGALTLSATLVQRFEVEGVTRQELDGERSGTLYTPAGPGPHPVIVVFNGSGGGVARQRAALYAAQGYRAVALGYFKSPGRPDHISDTPLEYFEAALRWIHAELAPARGFVALTGQSRGGELSLLLGARFPELVGAVIAYVPSSVVHGTLRAGRPGQQPGEPAWTWRGQALATVWDGNPQADWTAFEAREAGPGPVRQAPAFVSAHRHAPSVASARIPVERIAGPVMLVSGTDDGFWPSTAYAEEVAQTLYEHEHAWPIEHVRCQYAGHAIGVPNLPATLIAKPHPVAGVVLSGGGTASANARANRASWAAVQRFLREASA
ncbi:acyl-CoA thioester hydrolase [Bordetella genomosp. 1]|uniref:Acyl-CoA thioester hydrolase n=1 Tax=Bordetella genomosp. 1 TaxID=1395607 RepID=A0A261SED4_9BORD|nr:acyl-CoA thioester hydrolase/BAAT C-terminal domain-containing protein [Bordetella genomosp. 1]OZI35367.1 acyl-CoA thioester hydrolase [Bordetella genomosp. 1]